MLEDPKSNRPENDLTEAELTEPERQTVEKYIRIRQDHPNGEREYLYESAPSTTLDHGALSFLGFHELLLGGITPEECVGLVVETYRSDQEKRMSYTLLEADIEILQEIQAAKDPQSVIDRLAGRKADTGRVDDDEDQAA